MHNVDIALHQSLGLTDDEFELIHEIQGREPNDLELAMYSVMWSEHCSYKSSRIHLKRLPTKGERVLVGPGENAGVIDAGDGVAVAIRMESHNHPSAIEPAQGAATGAGGILRDIFTMGARPIAIMDPLYVGPLDNPRQRYLLEGIVRGISSYGNSVGVPTVGGELHVENCYSGNPLVNVLCVGVLPTERLVLGKASGVGNLALLLGSSTGRDGIGGVSVLASAAFDSSNNDEAKLPSVQVGDPFEEKRLIEACLELLDSGLVVGIQDLGGAGITCATSETASRAGLGMDVDVNAIIRREPNMSPVEVMTSESQERMLAIVTPENLEMAQKICDKWEVRSSVIGHVTACEKSVGRLRVFDGFGGQLLADVPASSLAEDAPLYDRDKMKPLNFDEDLKRFDPMERIESTKSHFRDELLSLVMNPSWIYRQYDHQLFLNTIKSPGTGAALLRLHAPGVKSTKKAIALTTDGNPGWCAIDPHYGTVLTTIEAATNIAIVGANPEAVVNCLNLGNPEHKEVMWQLSSIVDGLSEGCDLLGVPVVGGNVSLYNAHNGKDIDPTPVIGMIGISEDYSAKVPDPILAARPPDSSSSLDPDNKGGQYSLFLIGGPDPFTASSKTKFQLGGSRWGRQIHELHGGYLPEINRDEIPYQIELLKTLATSGNIVGWQDIGDGGMALAIAEMVIAGGNGHVGATISEMPAYALWSELPGRVVASIANTKVSQVMSLANSKGTPIYNVGQVGGDYLVFEGFGKIGVTELTQYWNVSLSSKIFA